MKNAIVSDVTSLFEKSGILIDKKIAIEETKEMYPLKLKVEDNWAYFTAKGFVRLKEVFEKEGGLVKNMGIVGIGSGVEGIAAAYVFGNSLQHLVVTDIEKEVVTGAIKNIRDAAENFSYELTPLVGSFCEPIEQKGYMLDLIHANIPNLPTSGGEDMSTGEGKGTFIPTELYTKYNPPDEFIRWALAGQYAYLQSAVDVLNTNGSVIVELGGRIPFDMVDELFLEVGMKYEDVVVGFKEQTEALIDFQGYHRLEKQYGVSFEFYLYDESVKLLQKNGLENPTVDISSREIKKLLSPYQITAKEALLKYENGVSVGHTVHVLRGQYLLAHKI